MKNKWRVSGAVWKISETSTEVEKLEVGIYKLEMSMFGPFLTRMEDKFPIPEKVYGSDKNLVDRVHKTYHATTGNLGVLLNGLKGTGKSLTAKMICNRMEMPVIMVDSSYNGATADFIAEIPDDVIFFFDEYEKNFSGKDEDGDIKNDHSLLSVMDGASGVSARKIFLLTTNEARVNENMLQRPGRIRYLKTFDDLSKEVIMEVVEDKLLNPDLKKCTVDFISKLEMISMDIVVSVIDEVNIHDEDPENFSDIFNVEQKEDVYNVYIIDEKGEKSIFKWGVNVHPLPEQITEEHVDNYNLNIDDKNVGTITAINEDGSIEVTKTSVRRVRSGKRSEDRREHHDTVKTFVIEKTYGRHGAFVDYGYAF